MKVIRVNNAFGISKTDIEKLSGLLKGGPKFSLFPHRRTGRLHLEVPEENEDWKTFENYCRQNNIRFSSVRRRIYSKAEIESAAYFFLADEPVSSNTDGTKYSEKGVCPSCGVGLTQFGPLIIDTKDIRLPKKKLFCVNLRQSREWLVATEIIGLLEGFSGIRFGDVCTASTPTKPLDSLKQIIVESHLPRMASATNFQEYDPPLKNRCSCNRAGWRLRDEIVYTRSALNSAKDFNLTVERWYGGGTGIKWPIVSQKFRKAMLANKLLKPVCFDPVHVIDRNDGSQYKFDLPLDGPAFAI